MLLLRNVHAPIAIVKSAKDITSKKTAKTIAAKIAPTAISLAKVAAIKPATATVETLALGQV